MFLYKSDVRIGVIKNKHFWTKNNDNIFHIFDQIKVSRVPLWIGHCQLLNNYSSVKFLNHDILDVGDWGELRGWGGRWKKTSNDEGRYSEDELEEENEKEN